MTGDTRSDTKKSTLLTGRRSPIFTLSHCTLAGKFRCGQPERMSIRGTHGGHAGTGELSSRATALA